MGAGRAGIAVSATLFLPHGPFHWNSSRARDSSGSARSAVSVPGFEKKEYLPLQNWKYGIIQYWEYVDIQYWEYGDIQYWDYGRIRYWEYKNIQYWEYGDIQY